MRKINYTNKFKRDYKREKKSGHHRTLDINLMTVVKLLAADKPLPHRNYDHPLTGEWKDHRDCHIKSKLLHLKGIL